MSKKMSYIPFLMVFAVLLLYIIYLMRLSDIMKMNEHK